LFKIFFANIKNSFAVSIVKVFCLKSSDRITILDNFGEYDKGEPLFIYGNVANPIENAFLIMQIINPKGDLCQIQQLIPLSNGAFLTEVIPLEGRICGLIE